jgi:hypothetical protein
VKYRKVDTKIWGDEKFRTFSDPGKLAFLFIMTHPALTALGAMRATLAGLAAEMGWPVKRMREALAPAIAQGMVEINDAASYIALPNFMKFNRPESPNVARASVTALDLIPECPEKQALVARCRAGLTGAFRQGFEEAFAEAFGEPLPKPFGEPLPEGLPYPEQEQEPEPEQKPETGTGVSFSPPPTPSAASRNGKPASRRKHVNRAWGAVS